MLLREIIAGSGPTTRVSHGALGVLWKPRLYRRWLDPMVRGCGYPATPTQATPLTLAHWETPNLDKCERLLRANDRVGARWDRA